MILNEGKVGEKFHEVYRSCGENGPRPPTIMCSRGGGGEDEGW